MEWETTEVTFDFLIAANYTALPLAPDTIISEGATEAWWNQNFGISGSTTIANLKATLEAQGLWSSPFQARFFAINPGNFDMYPYWDTIPVPSWFIVFINNTGYKDAPPAEYVELNPFMTFDWYETNITPNLPMTLAEYWQIVLDDFASTLSWYYRLRASYNPYS